MNNCLKFVYDQWYLSLFSSNYSFLRNFIFSISCLMGWILQARNKTSFIYMSELSAFQLIRNTFYIDFLCFSNTLLIVIGIGDCNNHHDGRSKTRKRWIHSVETRREQIVDWASSKLLQGGMGWSQWKNVQENRWDKDNFSS